jgi:anthranilate synthase component 1
VGAEALRRLAYREPEKFPVLLDSAASGPLSRYSILAAFPRDVLWQDVQGRVRQSSKTEAYADGFLQTLETMWRLERLRNPGNSTDTIAPDDTAIPFRGGWIVFLGYELAGEIEPRLRLPRPALAEDASPRAFALRIASGLIHDHSNGQTWAFAESDDPARLEHIADALATLPRLQPADLAVSVRVEEEAPELFHRRVRAALDYIRSGDVYQANLSRAWRGELGEGATSNCAAPGLYEQLRAVNPAPFGALAQFQDWRLLSCSPERLVRVCGTRVETRPIAGTRPRSGIGARHAREVAALIAHPKERAEHVMLIDLERNDLGRICQPGTVRTDEFMAIESYAHVHHIVSNVCGERLPDLTPIDVLRAVFPGGTITGCPKFRCMQIIAELEGEARQAYTGALGFINHDGSMDFNILIRSLTVSGNRVEFRTGAGIVADSNWRRELAETRAKARGVLAGIGLGGAA